MTCEERGLYKEVAGNCRDRLDVIKLDLRLLKIFWKSFVRIIIRIIFKIVPVPITVGVGATIQYNTMAFDGKVYCII